MTEEVKPNYYAIIPAYIRYNKDLKFGERLMYGEITALSGKEGYCFAKNKYFADLFEVSQSTISRWISHLDKLDSIDVEIIKNDKNEIIERRIYLKDNPYMQNCIYPYTQNCTEGIRKKVKDNNIKYNIDDLYYFIINNAEKIEFEFYYIVNKLELIYTEQIMSIMQEDKIKAIKEIVYVLYEIYHSSLKYILDIVNREELIKIYYDSKDHKPNDFLEYYRKSIINKYTNTS